MQRSHCHKSKSECSESIRSCTLQCVVSSSDSIVPHRIEKAERAFDLVGLHTQLHQSRVNEEIGPQRTPSCDHVQDLERTVGVISTLDEQSKHMLRRASPAVHHLLYKPLRLLQLAQTRECTQYCDVQHLPLLRAACGTNVKKSKDCPFRADGLSWIKELHKLAWAGRGLTKSAQDRALTDEH